MISLLSKLGLDVNHEGTAVPSLTPLHLTSLYPDEAHELYDSWDEIIFKERNDEYIRADADVFKLLRPGFSPGTRDAMITVRDVEDMEESATKTLVLYETTRPREISSFDFVKYYDSLKYYRASEESIGSSEATDWGNLLLYGSVVTSTNTMLEKYDGLVREAYRRADIFGTETKSCCQNSRRALPLPPEHKLQPVVEVPTSGLLQSGSSSCQR